MRRVVVTGIGAVSALGDVDGLTSWLRQPHAIEEQPEVPLPPRLGAFRVRRVKELPRPADVAAMSYRRLDRTGRMVLLAAREALTQAGLSGTSSAEIAVSMGAGGAGTATTGELFETIVREGEEAASPFLFPNTVPNAAAGQLGIALGLSGPSVTVAGNIVAGEVAILEGAEAVRSGKARFVLAGSVSEANRYYGTALRLLRCLAAEGAPAGPHDPASTGATLGEGCGVLLMEREDSALERGAPILARFDGGVEVSMPLPPGEVGGAAKSMCEALQQLAAPSWWCVSASGVPKLDRCERDVLDGAAPAAARRTIHGGAGFLIAGGGLRAVAAVASIAGELVPSPALAPAGAGAEAHDVSARSAGVITVGDGGELVALGFSRADENEREKQ